jgi:tripartite-type tricarboxylate transporter receptor subunit TctC
MAMLVRLVSLLLAALVTAAPALAQYPTRPVKLVPNAAPGTGPDVLARIMAARFTESLGQPVVVESHPGSNGNIAVEFVARSPADGYTLLICTDAQLAINPHIYSKMNVDPNKDLVPVAALASQEFLVVVNASFPAKTFAEFLDAARRANPPLFYGSAGNGSVSHLAMEMIKAGAGIDLVHVPYKGGGSATVAALLGGEIAVAFGGTAVGAQIKAGKLRGLAVTGAARSALFPDLPTIGETLPGFEIVTWFGLFAPAGTAVEVITRLQSEVARYLVLPEARERFNAAGGFAPWNLKPEEFAAHIRRDYEKYGKLTKDIGVRVD